MAGQEQGGTDVPDVSALVGRHAPGRRPAAAVRRAGAGGRDPLRALRRPRPAAGGHRGRAVPGRAGAPAAALPVRRRGGAQRRGAAARGRRGPDDERLDSLMRHQPSGVGQAGVDIRPLEPGIAFENDLRGVPGREPPQDVFHRQTPAADDRLATEDRRTHLDTF